MFITKLRIEKIPSTKHWILLEPLRWEGSEHIHVPAGYRTDLTTRWFEGIHTEASVIHDYCLSDLNMPFSIANEYYREAMIDLNVHPFRMKIILTGVSIYGWFKDKF